MQRLPQLWEILVPSTYQVSNDPNVHNYSLYYHRAWDKKVRKITGGLTVQLEATVGQWEQADGSVFIEKMIPVRISCTFEELTEICEFTKKHYSQKAIMAYQISPKCYIHK